MSLIDGRNENPFLLVVSLQLASAGTFQVLKLPLGFIRVLEWVSVYFDAVTSSCSVNRLHQLIM